MKISLDRGLFLDALRTAIQILNRGSAMGRSARKEREYQLRREEILRQAEKVFSVKGFRNASMVDIAMTSGYAVGTMYRIFEGKEHLYTTMVIEKIEKMIGIIRDAVTAEDTVMEKIRALVNAHFAFVENNTDFCRLFILGDAMAISEGMTILRERMMGTYFDYILFIEDFIQTGIRSGTLKEMDARTIATSLVGMINAYTFDWIIAPGTHPLCARVGNVLDIITKGVLKHEG
jgi:AcrR family transcriptional regulator